MIQKLLLLLCLFVCSLVARAAFGEDVLSDTSDKATSKEPEKVTLVITATRVESEVKDIGSSVSVVTGEELREKQYHFVLDALRAVPGVEIRRSGGLGSETSIFIRGTDSDHALLMVDGVQVHDPSSPSSTAVLNHLSTSDVERIEIVRGPQSTVYGSEAIGGVINIITKKGSGDPTAVLSAEGGSFNTFSEEANLSGGKDAFYYSASLSRVDSAGFSSRTDDAEDDSYRNTAFSGRLGTRVNESLNLDFVLRYIKAYSEFDVGDDVSLSNSDVNQLIARAQPQLTLFDGLWQQQLNLSVHAIERDNEGLGFSLPSEFRGRIFGVDWQHSLFLHENHSLVVGTDFEYQDSRSEVSEFPSIEPDVHNVALYIQDLVKYGEQFNAAIGFRLDEHEQFGTQATYRLAGSYEFQNTNTLLRGSVGSGFKAPSLNELFDSSFDSNNPNLQPEESVGFDVGVEQEMLPELISVGATYFYNDIDNAIVSVFVDPNFTSINVERVATNGVETFLRLDLLENLRGRLHYTYTDTEARHAASFGISDGSRLLRRPNHSLGADLDVAFFDRRMQTGLGFTYVGERADIDPITFSTVRADDYMLVHFRSSVRVLGNWEIFARVENLLDEDYEEILGFNSPGISAYGGVRVSF